MKSVASKVFSRIYSRGKGWAFSSNDFVDEFSRVQVDNAMSDLVKVGKIRRVCRGIYDFPKYSILLDQELSPDFDQVAHAFARKFNWRTFPSGDTALNLLGVSTQIPGRYVYLSDGPNRKYSIGNYDLEFKTTVLKDIGFRHQESGLIVQAIKALGRERITDSIICKIRNQLDEKRRAQIIKDTKSVTSWIYEYIKQICMEQG